MPRFLLVSLALALVAAQHLASALPVEAPEMVAPAPGPAAGEHETPAGDTDENLPSESESAAASLPPKPAKIMEDLDTNHDGKITHDELAARLKWVHEKENAGPSDEASIETEVAEMLKDEGHKEWFDSLDKDKDGSLSLEEKLADLAGEVVDSEEDKKNMAEMKEHEKKDFEWSDKDKSGKLSFEEVVRGQMSPGPEDITHSNHEEEMAEVDADKDKHVSLSEHLKNIDPELGEEEKSSMSEEDMKLHKESVASATEEEKTRFTKADKNKDGKLTSEEYASIFEDEAREGSEPSHVDMAKEVLERHDKNKDGALSADEIGPSEGAESLGWETHPPHVTMHAEL